MYYLNIILLYIYILFYIYIFIHLFIFKYLQLDGSKDRNSQSGSLFAIINGICTGYLLGYFSLQVKFVGMIVAQISWWSIPIIWICIWGRLGQSFWAIPIDA